MRFRYWYRILSVSLTAMLLVVAAGCSTTASGAKSAPITKAAGGMLNLDAAGTVQIPPGGVDGTVSYTHALRTAAPKRALTPYSSRSAPP